MPLLVISLMAPLCILSDTCDGVKAIGVFHLFSHPSSGFLCDFYLFTIHKRAKLLISISYQAEIHWVSKISADSTYWLNKNHTKLKLIQNKNHQSEVVITEEPDNTLTMTSSKWRGISVYTCTIRVWARSHNKLKNSDHKIWMNKLINLHTIRKTANKIKRYFF